MNGRLWFAITIVTAALGCGDAASSETDDSSGKDGIGDDGGGPSVTTDPLCKVKTQDDGAKLITCDDGTMAIVRDGVDGMDGAKGEPGPKGDPGADGDLGAKGDPGVDGSSCTVADNGDGTKTISCTDGTMATVADGAKGDPGPAGAGGVRNFVYGQRRAT